MTDKFDHPFAAITEEPTQVGRQVGRQVQGTNVKGTRLGDSKVGTKDTNIGTTLSESITWLLNVGMSVNKFASRCFAGYIISTDLLVQKN